MARQPQNAGLLCSFTRTGADTDLVQSTSEHWINLAPLCTSPLTTPDRPALLGRLLELAGPRIDFRACTNSIKRPHWS